MEAILKPRDRNGKWQNPDAFREAGLKFIKRGFYISDPWGSPSWYEFWKTERDKCIKGVEIEGTRLTGEHYFYLNFCPMLKAEIVNGVDANKVEGLPDFWDGDYEYYWLREISRKGVTCILPDEERVTIASWPEERRFKKYEELFASLKLKVKVKPKYLGGGYNLIVGKSRRKGYSYKAASIGAYNYFTRPKSLTIYAAYEKKFLYPKGLFSMCNDFINFINTNTGWTMPSDAVQKQDHIKASYVQYINGVKTEQGFKSEVMALTFKDNPDAARGKDAYDVFFEESGAFGSPGLLRSSYAATENCVKAGAWKTGMITVFGTSGDLEGGTADYSHMFNNPMNFGLLPVDNIWDEGVNTGECGFFHPYHWNTEGFYNKKTGQSDFEGSKNFELNARKILIESGATSSDLQKRMQEQPLSPSEAFSSASSNTFPVVELNRQLTIVKQRKYQQTKGTPVEFSRENGTVVARPILTGKAEPITSYYSVPQNIRGCPMIYEFVVEGAQPGLYKIGYDPIRQEQGTSLASIIVYKSFHIGSLYHSVIVAEYIGRYDSPDDIDRLAAMMAEYYNTTIMHENEVTGVKNYFRRVKKLHLLAAQPDAVISKNVKLSRVARVYGCHMNQQLKDAGERYVKDWLLTTLDFDENGSPVTVIDKIYSIRILEELISYNRKGNFDAVSALFMCMFQVQEEDLGKQYGNDKQTAKIKKLIEFSQNMYKK